MDIHFGSDFITELFSTYFFNVSLTSYFVKVLRKCVNLLFHVTSCVTLRREGTAHTRVSLDEAL